MFLANEELFPRFNELLESARQVDLASAWATEGAALAALERAAGRARNACRVRALVGIKGNSTTPDALERLDKIGELRVVDGDVLFHPKVYLFKLPRDRRLAWVGSANFTGMGFGGNEEVILETAATRQITTWFEKRWVKTGLLAPELLEEYRGRYQVPKNGWRDERPPPSVPDDGSWTLPREYRQPILLTLREMGGSGKRPDVLTRVHELMRSRLKAADYSEHKPGFLKWHQKADEERQELVKKGLMKRPPEVRWGTWELTRAGKEEATRYVQPAR